MFVLSRRHQTCDFRKRATSAPAEGPVHGLDLARRCEFPLPALQAQKWHVHGSGTFGAARFRIYTAWCGSESDGSVRVLTANLCTKILDFRGFDSIIILILRVGIPGPTGISRKV